MQNMKAVDIVKWLATIIQLILWDDGPEYGAL